MALTYRNTLRNHIVEVPEPADIIAAAEVEAERLFRLGPAERRRASLIMDKARTRAVQQRQTLTKMDESRRWERYTAPPVVVAPPPPPPTAEPAPVKAVKTPVKAVKATAKPEPVEEPKPEQDA